MVHTSDDASRYPPHYTRTVRVLLRYALVMIVIGLLSGVAFQESSKKLSYPSGPDEPGYLDATLRLALVHGHVLVTGVLFPIAMAGMLHLALACGGAEIGQRGLSWAVRFYLTFVTATVLLMLYKSYHVLLSARGGESDMELIDAEFFGGQTSIRHVIYGASHIGMAFGLCLFSWCVWRSLKEDASGQRQNSDG